MSVSSDQLMVTGGNFYQTTSGNIRVVQQSANVDSKGFDLLSKNVATTALHNSGQLSDPPKCHPGTRVAILDALVEWGAAEKHTFPIKWIHGPAGAGKTTIVRTLAELLASRGLLLAAFFFFRTDALRNGHQRLISTLAFQVCLAIPQARPHFEQAIETNPLIFSLSISQQIQTLIITPFNLASSDPSFDVNIYPRVILIDGLDECQDRERQQEILQIFSENIDRFSLPVAVLVASRPEHHIRATFDLGRLNKSSSRLSLDNSFHPDADIRKFYLDKFLDIRTSHPLRMFLPPMWPPSDTLDLLVRQASGQFIYASTVVKFVSSIRHDPSTRLDILLGVLDRGNLKPFEQLDMLYATIFHSVDPPDLAATLRLLGIILTPPFRSLARCSPHSPKFLEALLGMKKGEPQRLLLDLESLLTIIDGSRDVRVFHSSLSDFLFDKSRSAEFFLDKGDVYAGLATHCIFHMASAGHVVYSMTVYCIVNLASYLSQASPTQNLHNAIMQCDIEEMYRRGGQGMLRTIIPSFLGAIKSSNFPDAQLMYASHRQKFMEILRTKLALYWNPHDDDDQHLWFILAASTGTFRAEFLQSFFDGIGRTLSSDVVQVEGQKGLDLLHHYTVYGDTSIFPFINDLLNELGKLNDQGCSFVEHAHANFAIDLLRCISVTWSMHNHSDLGISSLPGGRASRSLPALVFHQSIQELLPVIIDRSSVQTGLTEMIQQPPNCFNQNSLTEQLKSSCARYNMRSKEQETRREGIRMQLEATTNTRSGEAHAESSCIQRGIEPSSKEQGTQEGEDSRVPLKEATTSSCEAHEGSPGIQQAVAPTLSQLPYLAVFCGVVCTWLAFYIGHYWL